MTVVLKAEIHLEVEELTLPEGTFARTTASMGLEREYQSIARDSVLSVAICLQKIADDMKNEYHERKRNS